MEARPDAWFRKNVKMYVNESRRAVAKYFGCEENNLVFVENATTGVNTILKSFPYTEGDAILINNLNYGAIENTVHRTACMFKAEVLTLEIQFPILNEEDVIRQYDEFLQQHTNIKIAVIDHISSKSAILWPIKRLAEICHKHGCLILVDGAHAPGQILNLNIEDLNVDFYTGNLHKWSFVPRGCAILWVHPKHQSFVKPAVTSWGHEKTFQEEFLRVPIRDSTAYATAKYFIDFLDTVGGIETVYQYNTDLITTARDYLLDEWKDWKVNRLPIPTSMEAPYMRVIQIPGLKEHNENGIRNYTETKHELAGECVFSEDFIGENVRPFHDEKLNPLPDRHCDDSEEECRRTTVNIGEKYGAWVAVVAIGQSLYVRVCAQIYNEMEDYKKLADLMKTLLI